MPKLVTNSWEPIINAFLFKVQSCSEFFNYYNVNDDEAMELARRRAVGYLVESISRLTSACSPDVDFYDYNAQIEEFGFEVTSEEIDILARLMLEMFLEKDIAKLRVGTNLFTSQDIKALFSGWNERKTFVDMFSKIQEDNKIIIDSYISKDRLTGKRKSVEYDM